MSRREELEEIQARLNELDADRAALAQTAAAQTESARSSARGAIASAVIAAAGLLGATLISANAHDQTPIDCVRVRSEVVELVIQKPDAWVHVPADSPIEAQCTINEYVDRLEKR